MNTENNNINPELVMETLEKYGLLWNVRKRPNYFMDASGDMIPSKSVSVIREDTNTWFCDKSDRYEVYQNWELVELVHKVANNFDLNVSKGGFFDEGGKIYLQVKTSDIKGIGENKDTVNGWLTALNSHDGSASLQWGETNVTVSCKNTFYSARKDMKNKFSHSVNMRDRIDHELRKVERVLADEKTLFETFFKFADVDVKPEHISNVVNMITGVDMNMSRAAAADKYHSKTIKRTEQLSQRIGEEMSYKGNTLWGLFSGVTSYTNKDLVKEGDELKGKLMGSAGKLDNKVYNSLVELIK